jgi:hypothetical protein
MPFVKGKSGNPSGRPRGEGTLKRKIERALGIGEMSPDHLDEIIQRLIEDAKAGDIRAAGILFERLEGRPAQTVIMPEIQTDELVDI